jgi:hypothetical protein
MPHLSQGFIGIPTLIEGGAQLRELDSKRGTLSQKKNIVRKNFQIAV